MFLSEQVEWALHCALVLSLSPDDKPIPAKTLAEIHGVPSAYLAKALQSMASAGIVKAVPGRNGGYRLGKVPSEVTFLDVVDAVEGDAAIFRCTEIRQHGRSSRRPYPGICGIALVMYRAQAAWRTELATATLADVSARLSGIQLYPTK